MLSYVSPCNIWSLLFCKCRLKSTFHFHPKFNQKNNIPLKCCYSLNKVRIAQPLVIHLIPANDERILWIRKFKSVLSFSSAIKPQVLCCVTIHCMLKNSAGWLVFIIIKWLHQLLKAFSETFLNPTSRRILLLWHIVIIL